jgi:hypothetical protein
MTTLRSGRKYTELSAIEKRDYLFEEGVRPTAYQNYKGEERPSAVLGMTQFARSAFKALQSEPLSRSLTFSSDEFLEPRQKLIHTYGTTAKVLFEPDAATPYTGIFSERAHGLARFSYAGPMLAVGAVPALALKFPIDGAHASLNIVVMNKLDRQQPFWHFFSKHSHNSVFQNRFTNILPTPRATNLFIRTRNDRFKTVVQDGTVLRQPVDGVAGIHTNGNPVGADEVKAPYRLILSPTKQAVESSDPKIDFRDDLARNIKPGTAIYEIYALTESEEKDFNSAGVSKLDGLLKSARRIGALTTESEFIASKWGDYRLFFQHSDQFLLDRYRKK